MPRVAKETKKAVTDAALASLVGSRPPFKEALTSPITTDEQQKNYKAKPPVADEVEVFNENAPGISRSKPDLLGHPYHTYLKERGLIGMFTTRDMLDFRQEQGWRIFKRPANSQDTHPIFLGTEGDTVQRGGLILVVRPEKEYREEIARNAQAYKEEVADLQSEMKETAKEARSEAEGSVKVQKAEFPSPAPVDELQ